MNFIKGSLFRRNTEPEELEPVVESGGGVLAVWGSPGCCLLYTSDAADE